MQRVAKLVDTKEGEARRDLAAANRTAAAADDALEAVFEQCRQIATNDNELSLRFGRALIESGWLAVAERQAVCDQATAVATDKRIAWQGQRTRLDALGRLIERLQQLDTVETARQFDKDLDDLINARTVVSGRASDDVVMSS